MTQQNKTHSEQPSKVLIGVPIPTNKQIDAEVAVYCTREALNGRFWTYMPTFDPSIGRNRIVDEYLLSGDYTHVFFLDSDTVPPFGTIDRLLEHDKDIVAGVYPLRDNWENQPAKWSAAFWAEKEGKRFLEFIKMNELPGNLFKAAAIGGSTVLIKRKVFEALRYPYYAVQHNEKEHMYLGEDCYFSCMASLAGFDIWVDPAIKCSHYKLVDILPRE